MKVYVVFSNFTYHNNCLHEIPNIIEIFSKIEDANTRCFDLGENTHVQEHEVIE